MSSAHKPSQLQCFPLSGLLYTHSCLPAVLNKNRYIRTVQHVLNHSGEHSDIQQISIYWLLWYKPLITWKADVFLHRPTEASSSFLSGGRLTHNAWTLDTHYSSECERNHKSGLFYFMNIYWYEEMLTQNTPGYFIDHMLQICSTHWIHKQKTESHNVLLSSILACVNSHREDKQTEGIFVDPNLNMCLVFPTMCHVKSPQSFGGESLFFVLRHVMIRWHLHCWVALSSIIWKLVATAQMGVCFCG